MIWKAFQKTVMEQTQVVSTETGIGIRRASGSRTSLVPASLRIKQLQKELESVKKKLEVLSERVRELEKASVEFVDLTGDSSSSLASTVSVGSDAESPNVPNGIWKKNELSFYGVTLVASKFSLWNVSQGVW